MKILIDTHILIWALSDVQKLSANHKKLLEDYSNEIYVSQFSLMEITIKLKSGKLTFHNTNWSEFYQLMEMKNFMPLQISKAQIDKYADVHLYENHKDPFDRFLIATAIAENLSMMTADKNFRLYSDIIELV
jgi:PIN domain nuclease of toxin-antitoxin system